jgi:hypothetical protein
MPQDLSVPHQCRTLKKYFARGSYDKAFEKELKRMLGKYWNACLKSDPYPAHRFKS